MLKNYENVITVNSSNFFIMVSDLKQEFEENGYVVIKNVIPKSKLNELLKHIYNLYVKFSEKKNLSELNEPWNSDEFHKQLIELRKSSPEKFGAIFDSLKTSLILTQLVSNEKLVGYVSDLLGANPNELSESEKVVRLDPPLDERSTLEWHQERSYFPQNRSGLHGLVASMPVINAPIELGPLDICPKSHQVGQLKVSNKEKNDLMTATQFVVPDEMTSKYEVKSMPLNAGDVIIFNFLLFHRSGRNISNKVRMTAVGRFHISTADDFLPFDLSHHYNSYVKNEILEKKYDCSDIPNNKRQSPVVLN